jgi:hypothetical protein
MEADMKTVNAAIARTKLQPAWLRRLGVGGFLFFLVKGLLWLTVPAMLAMAGLE